MRGRLRLAATLPSTRRALAAVTRGLAQETPLDDLRSIELGLAEVLTNLVKHGYGDGDAGRISLHWKVEPHAVDLQVSDTGRTIPSAVLDSAGDTPLDFENTDLLDLPESGLGLALVMRVFDSVSYRSRNNVNRMQLRRLLR